MKYITDFLRCGDWWISRDGSIDMWGEWEPSCSWSGYRRLSDDLVYRIRVCGAIKNGRCKPSRWSSELDFNGMTFSIKTSHPSCASVKNASQLADKSLTLEVFKRASSYFYSQGRKNVRCVAKKGDGMFTPYLSHFGAVKWVRHYNSGRVDRLHPTGEYLVASRNWRSGEPQYSSLNLGHWGYGGGGTEEVFNHWLPATPAPSGQGGA